MIGIVCATENMPSGKAQKPGEFRLPCRARRSRSSILTPKADWCWRMASATRGSLGCTHLIDAATLTGAVVVALGYANAGIFANDDAFYERFNKALNKAGEKMWRLPVNDEYLDQIASNIADMMNTGGRWGGRARPPRSCKEFAEDTPWLHLDIAGTAWMEDRSPGSPRGLRESRCAVWLSLCATSARGYHHHRH